MILFFLSYQKFTQLNFQIHQIKIVIFIRWYFKNPESITSRSKLKFNINSFNFNNCLFFVHLYKERFSISRKALIEKLRIFNKGTDTKHLYDPKEVMPILENLHVTNKRGARRKN